MSEGLGQVVMLPGADRPEGALNWLAELLGNGDAAGVVVIAVDKHGRLDPRVFGLVRRYELAFAGAILAHHSVTGDFE